MGRRVARGGGKPAGAFGALLAQLRGRRSLRDVEREARQRRLALTYSALNRYEKGRVPDVVALDVLAKFYGVSFDGLSNALRHELTVATPQTLEQIEAVASDPLGHTGRVRTSADEHAEARRLQQENAALRKELHAANEFIGALAVLYESWRKDRPVTQAPPAHRRGARSPR